MFNAKNMKRGGALTREQFLLREIQITAKLWLDGLDEARIESTIKDQNLFQFSSPETTHRCIITCLQRLAALSNGTSDAIDKKANSQEGGCSVSNLDLLDLGARTIEPESNSSANLLISLIANGLPDQAIQVNLYAMMRLYRLFYAFMTDEIGMRLRSFNFSFTPMDLNAFMAQYQADNPEASQWSEATVKRIKSTLKQCLVKAGYLDNNRSTELRPLLLDLEVRDVIIANGDADILYVFNGRGAE